MKIIISHDIDHFYWSDHILKDLFIPKYVVKNTFYWAKGLLPFEIYKNRMASFRSNRFSRLKELTEFNKLHQVPASYFMGVKNALNLSYSLKTAAKIAAYLKSSNYPLYVHGIAYETLSEIIEERKIFSQLSDRQFLSGIRMHYLRRDENTFLHLEKAGYTFDSTEYAIRNPYKIGNMIEFPVSMMEVYMMGYDSDDLEKIKTETLERVHNAEKLGIKFFTIIFHDHHFSEAFPIHRDWYEWLVKYFKANDFAFTNFEDAVADFGVT